MDRITITRGSDRDFEVEWIEVDSAATERALNLSTASAPELFEAHPALVGHIALAVDPDPLLGIVQGEITWQDDMLDGDFMHFRVRVVVGGKRRTTGLIQVRVA